MLDLDKERIDKYLLQLEKGQFIDPRYQFVKADNKLKLLGAGGFAYVYEMYDSLAPENRYAAKVTEVDASTGEERFILETTQIQYVLSEQSENIMRVIALWSMKLQLDENGNITGVIRKNQEEYKDADGVLLEIILLEKLEKLIDKDKYGNIELSRDELKTEEGVIRFAKDIGRALFTIHSNGYLHRDIKLENIFWDENLKQYKLGDFGIARYVGKEGAETVVFTNGYGAPEIEKQLVKSYNLTADIYSFGITLFLLLNGLKFPASDGYYTNVIQYSKDFILPAPEFASPQLTRIIRKMCSYRAEDRYQSAEEILLEIGKIDGDCSNCEFTEYPDLETETYREPDNKQNEDKNNSDEMSWLEKEDYELSREERKKKLQYEKEDYTFSSIWKLIMTALWTVLLLKSFSPDAPYINQWEFWILPIVLLVEAILQRMKEFHIEFGIITVGVLLLSIQYLGIDAPQIMAIVAVLIGIPGITAGVSIGIGLWIAQMLTGKLAWLSICSTWDLGWIILIMLAGVIESSILLRKKYKRATNYETLVVSNVMGSIGSWMTIAGVIMLVLGHFNIIVIPDIVKRIHFIRVGIGVNIIKLFWSSWYGLSYRGEDNVDESLDKR